MRGRPPERTLPHHWAGTWGADGPGLFHRLLSQGGSRFGWMAPGPQAGDGDMWRSVVCDAGRHLQSRLADLNALLVLLLWLVVVMCTAVSRRAAAV